MKKKKTCETNMDSIFYGFKQLAVDVNFFRYLISSHFGLKIIVLLKK